MFTKIRNTLAILATTATPVMADNTTPAEEIVSYLLSGDRQGCVETALQNAVADENAIISWSHTADSDGKHTKTFSAQTLTDDFTILSSNVSFIADNDGVKLIPSSVSAENAFNDKIASGTFGGLTAHYDNPESRNLADFTEAAQTKLIDEVYTCVYGAADRTPYLTRRLEPIPTN